MKEMNILINKSKICFQHLKDNIKIELNRVFPNPRCELNFNSLFELIISVMLSSQTLDKRVNEVTKILFTQYPTIKSLQNCDLDKIEEIIRPLGLSKVKARNIKNIANDIIEKFKGKVPETFQELISLSGVGEKTAQVVLIEGLNVPAFPVDTHVLRISKRLNIVDTTVNVTKASEILKNIFDKDDWSNLHKQMVLFGRYVCKAKNPECENCRLKSQCKYYKQNNIIE